MKENSTSRDALADDGDTSTVDGQERKEKNKSLLLLFGENYVISGSIGLRSSSMKPTVIHVDTCSGVNVIREGMLPPKWDEHLEPLNQDPNLGDANGRPLRFKGLIRMSVRLNNRLYRIPFLIATNFAADVLLGTAFLNTHIRSIRCIEKQIELANGETIPIIEINKPASGADAHPEKGAPSVAPKRKSRRHPASPLLGGLRKESLFHLNRKLRLQSEATELDFVFWHRSLRCSFDIM